MTIAGWVVAGVCLLGMMAFARRSDQWRREWAKAGADADWWNGKSLHWQTRAAESADRNAKLEAELARLRKELENERWVIGVMAGTRVDLRAVPPADPVTICSL